MYSAKILEDSINPCENRLTTFELTYPRFVHSEFMTHRMLSRNSASSRAIPIEKMIQNVLHDPVKPVWWGKNQSGMQARERLEGEDRLAAEYKWLDTRLKVVDAVRDLQAIGLHKQIANRLLEPWMWITVIASATDWWHFFNLRSHADAQPEIRRIADMALELYESHKPRELRTQQWHLPLITSEEREVHTVDLSWVEVSVGRCARVSYLTHDGRRDTVEDMNLCSRLKSARPMHASPFEHQAYALDKPERVGNFTGWFQYRKMLQNEYANEHRIQA